jgi:hypothetical protein
METDIHGRYPTVTASAKRARSCLVVGNGTERVVRQPLLRVRLISVIDPHHVWGVRKVA